MAIVAARSIWRAARWPAQRGTGPEHFGEGVTTWNDQIIQLTWKSHLGLFTTSPTFRLLKTFNYPTEGWGLTHDGTSLIMSDGTSILHFMDPSPFKSTADHSHDQGQPVVKLNELEYVRAKSWPMSGRPIASRALAGDRAGHGWIDLTGLLNQSIVRRPPTRCSMASRYDAGRDRLFVTGKWWLGCLRLPWRRILTGSRETAGRRIRGLPLINPRP